MIRITKGWPPSRREKQAQNCRKNRPWDHATGPRSEKGKEKAAQNAHKHGRTAAQWRLFRSILNLRRRFLHLIHDLIRRAQAQNLSLDDFLLKNLGNFQDWPLFSGLFDPAHDRLPYE